MSNLSPTQLVALRVIIDGVGLNRDEVIDRWWSVAAPAPRPAPPSPEGLGITTGSLVRRGLVTRSVIGGRVHWNATDKGRAAARSYR